MYRLLTTAQLGAASVGDADIVCQRAGPGQPIREMMPHADDVSAGPYTVAVQ